MQNLSPLTQLITVAHLCFTHSRGKMQTDDLYSIIKINN